MDRLGEELSRSLSKRYLAAVKGSAQVGHRAVDESTLELGEGGLTEEFGCPPERAGTGIATILRDGRDRIDEFADPPPLEVAQVGLEVEVLVAVLGEHEQTDPGGPEGLAVVPAGQEEATIESAEECPGECIFIEV